MTEAATASTLETKIEGGVVPHAAKRDPADVGAVVQVYTPEALEVEFVTATGATQAVVTLRVDSVRPVGRNDLLAVRQLNAA